MSRTFEPLVLDYLRHNDGATERPRAIASALDLPLSEVVDALERLERQKLVVRVGRFGRGNFTSLWRAA